MSRLKIGVIGCGAIAQIQHLPHLRELDDRFEIGGLADLSPKLLEAVGSDYDVPPERRFLDYRELVRSDVDGVIVCPSGSHAAPSIAAAQAGKHVFVEKPMCTTVREAEAMVAAADAAGVLLMVGYMKRHEPAYQFAQARVREMSDVRFIQVNHLHPDNDLHTSEFKVRRFDDIPGGVRDDWNRQQTQLIAQALDYADGATVPRAIAHAYNLILGSMIHDIGNLHGLFGTPRRVLSSEIWLEGRAVSTVLDYGEQRRAVASWVDLPDLWDFKETLEVYGSRERVLVSFPTGFARGLPSHVTLHGMDADPRKTPWRREYAWHDNPFKLELLHFGECIRSGQPPLTPGSEAVADIQLVGDIVKTYLTSREN
ncbi:MAG: Gfo/Idh/MocA family oxidoreductase [Chloroflexota bacterium]|nr:Gfo/Idh/MocA family oxidoreductase [Chloroflexota bacterium]